MSFPRYPEYKDSGAEWLEEVPVHWECRRLAYYFEERRQKVSDIDYRPLSVTKSGVVPQLDTAAKTSDGENRKLVRAGDFVINSRSDRKGSSGASELDGSVSLISTVLRPRNDVAIQFAHHLLRSVPFQEEFYRYGKGIVADLWSTNYAEMSNIVLALPHLAEQVAIATFLDRETAKIDALVAEQEKLIALLKEKRQAVISHAVTKGLNPDAPMKPSGIEWLGDVPAHWEVRRISSISTKITNGFVGPTRDILVDEGVWYLQSLHIKSNRIRFDQPYFVRQEWSNNHAKSILESGDVLIVQTGDIGQVAVVTEEFAGCNCHALIIVAPLRSVVAGQWLSWVLNSDYGHHSLLSIQTGALHPHLNCGNVKDIAVPVPPIAEQHDIVGFVENLSAGVDDLMAQAERAITLLKEHRSALISAAVTGQIDVRDLAHGDLKSASKATQRSIPWADLRRGGDDCESDALVWISVEKVDAAWKAGDCPYIGPGGTGNTIGDRYSRFGNWLVTGADAVEFPMVALDTDGSIGFTDGRHRFAWLRDHGVRSMPVQVPADQVANFQTRFGTPDRMSYWFQHIGDFNKTKDAA